MGMALWSHDTHAQFSMPAPLLATPYIPVHTSGKPIAGFCAQKAGPDFWALEHDLVLLLLTKVGYCTAAEELCIVQAAQYEQRVGDLEAALQASNTKMSGLLGRRGPFAVDASQPGLAGLVRLSASRSSPADPSMPGHHLRARS